MKLDQVALGPEIVCNGQFIELPKTQVSDDGVHCKVCINMSTNSISKMSKASQKFAQKGSHEVHDIAILAACFIFVF